MGFKISEVSSKKDLVQSTANPGTATTTTHLPGLEGIQVIVASPTLIKENSTKVSHK